MAAFLVLPGAPLAFAGGGTGGGGTGGDTGGPGDSTTGTPDPGGSSGDCGSCSPPATPVSINSPADGVTVPADTTISVEVTYSCSCDDCGCFQDFATDLTVTVDGNEVFACFDGCTGPYDVNVNLTPGSHEITATAQYSFHTESDTITVNVADGGSGGGGGSGDSGGSGGSTGGGSGGGGCHVAPQGPAGLPGLAALLLGLGVVARRRRRA